ncbi:Tetraspanin family-domain-containing protein [Halteromyces radiatus]|uniref:Tetraspanin family-domain-containing protein n=1 Tax=Halteromyces radiatus TaxID=101107 RepID=UPI00221F8ECB|nr:Tetraspanin family-domain-containing protein [Halteromyces radiatus]KAI8089110.1 Tetraspanin family-domain-containing protein [Halteromyces radiatus]
MIVADDEKVNRINTPPPVIHHRQPIRSSLRLSNTKHSVQSDVSKPIAPHLRSCGRSDIVRQRVGFLGWTIARWILLLTNTMLLVYGCIFLVATCATYGLAYERAIIIVIANKEILAVSFTASLFCFLTSIVGYIGIVNKNRRYLGYYALFLWVCFALIITVGYLGFKHRTWNLKAQLGVRWRHDYTPKQRELLQDNLHCCGFENPSDHAAYFLRCWAQSLLPGCQHKFYLFENAFLLNTYTIAFAILPIHVAVILASILCSNHVDVVFGTRSRPPIPYLGEFKDWREWEQAMHKQK